MKLTAALAADLYALTAALGEPDTDIGGSLRCLIADSTAAIPSYLGLTVIVTQHDPPSSWTVLSDRLARGDVRTSLGVEVSGTGQPTVSFILYAASSGAFVDLAADLRWLTDRRSVRVTVDAHLDVPADTASAASLRTESTVNQAIGALIGRGHTPTTAHRELDRLAAAGGSDRLSVAHQVLGTVSVAVDGQTDTEGETR